MELKISRNIDDIKPTEWKESFYFIQAADTQYGLIERWKDRTNPDWLPNWEAEIALSEQLVDTCNKMQPKPKFMVVCGDLVDAFPKFHQLRRNQIADFKKVFSKLSPDIPLVCVCGNHDVGDIPTMSAIEEYKRDFGDDYYHFSLNGVLFIVINSQFYENREHVQDYARQQDEWLESILPKCKLFKYSIVFEHIPWFLKDPNEDKDYFNISKEIRLVWLRKFKDAGVNKIMCGHYHKNAGGWFEDMELVVTSAIGLQLGDDKSGARIVKVKEDNIEHKYYSLDQLPTSIDLANSKSK